MLPYHLRVPVYGKSNEDIKKSTEEEKSVAARGGPVQVAIEEDILLLRAKYVKDLLAKSGMTKHHDKEGFAFGCFRHHFAKSKVAMLHLLLPKSSCDKEAYSQLIYASCLQVFRKAFTETTETEKSLESTGFALFCLYALYETNTLPHATKSPFELLSMGLQGDENYRALYRRVFRQNIRIDHEHYGLILRLRQLCFARIDACRKRFYERMLQSSWDDAWKCNCAIARDTINIIDILEKKWDYCDYTGPVGLEGLAGHGDYITDSFSKMTAAPVPMQPKLCSTEFQFSAELKQSLQAYQNGVKDIQVPVGRIHTMTKVRKCLEDFFATTRADPLSQAETRLFGTGIPGDQHTRDVPRDSEQALRDKTEDSNETYSRVFVVGDQNTDGGNNSGAVLPSFKSIVPPALQNDTKKYLHQAMGSLFKRQLPLLESAAIVGGEDTDDVSSVGFGGISVATGAGRNALQALLSKANAKKGVPSRVEATNVSNKRQVDNNSSMQFLTAENTFMDQAESEDEGSDISNISISDYEDDDDENNFDDTSVATSAAGKQALSSLLNRAKRTQAQTQKEINSKKRKRVAGKRSTQSTDKRSPSALVETTAGDTSKVAKSKIRAKRILKANSSTDAVSTCTSVGGGQNALAALLGQAQQKKEDSEGNQRRPVRRKKFSENGYQTRQSKCGRGAKEATTEFDDLSMTSSIGHGQNALGSLLAQARTTKGGSNSDGISLASSSGQGEGALATLLSRAGSETNVMREENIESASVTTTPGQGQGALDILLAQRTSQKKNTGYSGSLATSVGVGKGALDALLKQATQTSNDDGLDS